MSAQQRQPWRIQSAGKKKNMENSSEIDLPQLTEDCISAILSFTTPRDVCRLSAVSRLFRSAANGDSLWSNFIPQQSFQILPRAVTPVACASRRELYFRLCDSVLIDGGTQRFWLERSTGKIGYMLSATELSIAWGNDQRYWNWPLSGDHSRFGVLAELNVVYWFDVFGQIDCRLLSEDTQYKVVYVLKFAERSFGWSVPIKLSVTGPDGQERESSRVFKEMQRAHNGDEWLGVVAGEFTLRANENEGGGQNEEGGQNEYSHMKCKFSMREVELGTAKGGLVLDGVRFEPVNSSVGV